MPLLIVPLLLNALPKSLLSVHFNLRDWDERAPQAESQVQLGRCFVHQG
jgi:hypothetical protein